MYRSRASPLGIKQGSKWNFLHRMNHTDSSTRIVGAGARIT